MKQILTITVLLSASILVFSCKSKKKDQVATEKEVENLVKKSKGLNAGSGNFDVTTPDGWERVDTTEMGMKICYLLSPQTDANDQFRENINIVTERTSGMALESYMTLSKTNMKKMLANFN